MNVALQRNKQMMDHTCLYSLPHNCFSVSGSFLAVFNSLLLSQVSFFAFCTIDVKTSVSGGSGWSKLNFLFPLWLMGACPQADQGPAGCHHMAKVKWQKMGECWAELAAHQHQGRTASLAPHFFSLHLNLQWRVAVGLSSPQVLPPSPLQSHHSLSDVLPSCLGKEYQQNSKKPKLITFCFFRKLIFWCFNMLKWLGKGHDKAWQRTATREGQEQNAQRKGSERIKSFPL